MDDDIKKVLELIKSFMDKTTWKLAEKTIKDAIDDYGMAKYSDGYDAGHIDGGVRYLGED